MNLGGRSVPGFLTVRGAAQGLRLAPRSVRDLIYAGRLPSVRLGRLHYVSAADVELERRRRRNLAPPAPRRPRRARLAVVPTTGARRRSTDSPSADQSPRRARAAEREALRQQWLRAGRQPENPALPFQVDRAVGPAECPACGKALPVGAGLVAAPASDGVARLCLTCGRRTVLRWADERRRESAFARRFAQDLGRTLGPSVTAPAAGSAVA